MVMEYVNRKGDTYYLQQGKTKTGKPKYYFGRRLSAVPLDAMPEGYEVYENPRSAQVYLRKVKPTEVTAMEREMVADGVRRHAGLQHFVVAIEGDSLVIYTPGENETDAAETSLLPSSLLSFSAVLRGAEKELIRHRAYSEMLRFELVDAAERLYAAERWCFLGSIDDWVHLDGPAPLSTLVEQYVPHLGKETFYELK